MRKSLLATAFGSTLILAGAALAQTPAPSTPAATPAPPAAAAPPASAPMPPDTTAPAAAPADSGAAPSDSAPKPMMKKHWMKKSGTGAMSATASNTTGDNVKGDIAPKLPSPALGENAGPADYLNAAKMALKAHKTGEAQQALEMAETRALDADGTANKPTDGDPMITNIRNARDALAKKDWKGTSDAIDTALSGAPAADKPMMKPMHHHKMMMMKKKDAMAPATPDAAAPAPDSAPK